MGYNAIIEIPQNSIYKYEKDGESLILDRILNQPIPVDYGFIPDTMCGDGDPLDVFVISPEPLLPLSKVKIEVFGILKCKDNGFEDDKVLAKLEGHITYYKPEIYLSDIVKYLKTYKSGFEVGEFIKTTTIEESYFLTIQSPQT